MLFPNVIRRRFCVPNRLLVLVSSSSVEALDDSHDSPHFEPNPRIKVRRQMQETAKLGNLDEALRALELLNPNILDYNGMLHCYFKSGRVSVEMVAGIFQGMKRFGPHPNVWTFNILFNGLCSLGLLKAALFVLEDMCCHRFVPSFASLMKLMKKSLDSGTFEISVQVLELMLRFGYMPSLIVVNRLIAGLSKEKRIHEAYHVFSVVLEMGLVPNVYTFNSLLFGVCLWKEAYRTLEEMRIDGCLPTDTSESAFTIRRRRRRNRNSSFRRRRRPSLNFG
nr:pentatricopeptide repeat protein AaPPR630 [Agave angustifolia]